MVPHGLGGTTSPRRLNGRPATAVSEPHFPAAIGCATQVLPQAPPPLPLGARAHFPASLGPRASQRQSSALSNQSSGLLPTHRRSPEVLWEM